MLNNTSNNTISENISDVNDETANVLYSAWYDSNLFKKFQDFINNQANDYVLSVALILTVIKIAIQFYHFVKDANKNFSKSSYLTWNIARLALIALSFVGSIALGAAFALLSSLLFIVAGGMDLIRNTVLLGWNVYKYNSLYFSGVSKQLSNDPLGKIKREELRVKYNNNIKRHLKNTFFGVLLTASSAIVFLFPHVGLGGVAATTIVVGAVKVTVAKIAAITASTVMLGPLITSGLVKAKNFIQRKINAFNNAKADDKQKDKAENKKIESNKVLIWQKTSTVKQQPEFRINDINALNDAENKLNNFNLGFNACFYKSKSREIIIKCITTQDLAKNYLIGQIREKIQLLSDQINANQDTWSGKWQQKTRVAKIAGLNEILTALQNNQSIKPVVETLSSGAHSGFYLSRFVDESDCGNIARAALEYEARFAATKLSQKDIAQQVHSLSL